MTRFFKFSGTFCLVFLLIFIGCIKKPVYDQREFLMDTFVEIKIFGIKDIEAKEISRKAFDEMRRVYNVFNRYSTYSLVYQETLSRKIRSAEILNLLDKSIEISKLSGGAFDVTIAPLLDLWGFGSKDFRVPKQEEILAAKAYVGYEKLVKKDSSYLLEKGMALDFGAIGKGYAVDRAIQILKDSGVSDAVIDAGGDVVVLGDKSGKGWNIAVKHPRDKGKFLGILHISSTAAVVTSGDYERFFEEKGKKYTHVLDPKTGYPAEKIMSVTIVSESCAYADAIATAIFVLGYDAGIKLVESLDNLGVIIVDKDMNIYISESLKDSFSNA